MPSSLFRPGDRPLLNLGLLAATLLTTFGTFLFLGFSDQASDAAAFAVSLVCILGAHEMGHYLLARHHQVDSSLPYFIPLPLIGVGTLGAVIRIRGRIPHRNALVDIGAAGPLAGLVVAVPILLWGLAHSTVADAPAMSRAFPGENSLWVLLPELARWIAAQATGAEGPSVAPVARSTWIFGDNLLMLGLQRVVLGPLPPGKEVYVHATVIAGWFGLLVTMLNLIPIGQLDGGHLTHAVFGDRARLLGKVMAGLLALLVIFFTVGWLLWLVVTAAVIGFKHPPVTLPDEPLSKGRQLICALCLLAFVVSVMPVPITQVGGP